MPITLMGLNKFGFFPFIYNHLLFSVGKLNLVDLAGSERVRITGATGKRLEECKKIN